MTSEVLDITTYKYPAAVSLLFLKKEVANCFIDPATTTCLIFDLQHCVTCKKRITEHTAWQQAVLENKECQSGSLKLSADDFCMVFFLQLFCWVGLAWGFLPCPLG